MQNGIEKIKWYKFYDCGFCLNDYKHIYKNTNGNKKFHARVLLINHKKYGYILVDTGYGKNLYDKGLLPFLYNKLNPAYFEEKVSIASRLLKDGIDPKEIKHIILTHLHPDHIGGVGYFENATFLLSSEACKNLYNRKFKDCIFKGMVKNLKKSTIKIINCTEKSPLENFVGNDLLKDGSLWVINLDGHARGQMGVYLDEEKLFYVADAIWSVKYMKRPIKATAKLIQYDKVAYENTVKKLCALNDVNIYCTHD